MECPAVLPGGNSAVTHSDILIKALVEKDEKAISKLRSYLSKLDPTRNEFFIITEFITNDVLTKAKEKGIPHLQIIRTLLPPYTSYFHLSIGGYAPTKYAVDSILEYSSYNLTLADWTTLFFMALTDRHILISDKKEFDDVIKEKKLANHLGRIKRI